MAIVNNILVIRTYITIGSSRLLKFTLRSLGLTFHWYGLYRLSPKSNEAFEKEGISKRFFTPFQM